MRLSKYFLFVFFLFSFFISSFSSTFSQTFYGYASWYGIPFHGRKTASGLIFNMNALTAAHKKLPFGTKVRVTNLTNGRSVIVTITDRGPFKPNRIIDVSKKAAEILGFIQNGLARVKLEVIASDESLENSYSKKQSSNDRIESSKIKESFKPVNSVKTNTPQQKPKESILLEDSKDLFIPTEEANSIPAFTKDVADFDMYKKSQDLYMNQKENDLDYNSEAVQSEMARKKGTHNLDEYYRKHYYDNPDYYLGETNIDPSPKEDPFIEKNKKEDSIQSSDDDEELFQEEEDDDDVENKFEYKYNPNEKLPLETVKASPKNKKEESSMFFKSDPKNYVTKKVYYVDLKEKVQHYSQDKLLYKIQFGAYSQILIAKTQQKRFKNLNIETEICILPNQYKGELVRLLGKETYQDYTQVKMEQEKLKKLNIDSWIIQVND